MRLLVACAIAAVALLAPLTAAAGNSISVNQENVHWGDAVTFTVSVNASLVQVLVTCYATGGGVVWNGVLTPQFAPPLSPPVVLSGAPFHPWEKQASGPGFCRAAVGVIGKKSNNGPLVDFPISDP